MKAGNCDKAERSDLGQFALESSGQLLDDRCGEPREARIARSLDPSREGRQVRRGQGGIGQQQVELIGRGPTDRLGPMPQALDLQDQGRHVVVCERHGRASGEQRRPEPVDVIRAVEYLAVVIGG